MTASLKDSLKRVLASAARAVSIVIVLLCATISAVACQPSLEIRLNIPNYDKYQPKFNPDFETMGGYIALVKTTGVGEHYSDLKTHSPKARDNGSVEIVRIEYVETILGLYPENEEMKSVIYQPLSTEAERQAERQYANSSRAFGFWDQLPLGYPILQRHGYDTGCGFYHSRVLFRDSYYLKIFHPQLGWFYEPVTGPQDAVVRTFRNWGNKTASSPLRMPKEAFFEQIDAYNHFKISACPPDIKGIEPMRMALDAFQGSAAFQSLDDLDLDIEKVHLLDLWVQGWRTKDLVNFDCRIGDEYLVIYEDYQHNRKAPIELDFKAANAKFRFLKVTDGSIDVRHILTNIDITGHPVISVGSAKNYIRSGQGTK